jgi:hypothetical protein
MNLETPPSLQSIRRRRGASSTGSLLSPSTQRKFLNLSSSGSPTPTTINPNRGDRYVLQYFLSATHYQTALIVFSVWVFTIYRIKKACDLFLYLSM